MQGEENTLKTAYGKDKEMIKYWDSFVRKAAPVLGAGLLLQAGGCTLDTGTIASGLLTTIAGHLISSVVYGVFNVPLSGF
jgi:hypothetical protein